VCRADPGRLIAILRQDLPAGLVPARARLRAKRSQPMS
jgi:hypothetical protein